MAETKTKKPADRGSRLRSWFIVCPNVRTRGVAEAKPEDIATWTEHLHVVLCDVNKAYFNTVKNLLVVKHI